MINNIGYQNTDHCFLFIIHYQPPSLNSWEVAFGPTKRWTTRPFLLGRIQKPSKNLFHCNNQVLRRIGGWTGGPELLVELHVSLHCLIGAHIFLRFERLVFHGLGAEPAYPTALVPLSHPRNVVQRAILRQSAAVTLHQLHAA